MPEGVCMSGRVNHARHSEVASAVYDVLHTVSDAQIGIRRAELIVDRAREIFAEYFSRPDDGQFDEVEAVLYGAAALLRELNAKMEESDRKHREAVK